MSRPTLTGGSCVSVHDEPATRSAGKSSKHGQGMHWPERGERDAGQRSDLRSHRRESVKKPPPIRQLPAIRPSGFHLRDEDGHRAAHHDRQTARGGLDETTGAASSQTSCVLGRRGRRDGRGNHPNPGGSDKSAESDCAGRSTQREKRFGIIPNEQAFHAQPAALTPPLTYHNGPVQHSSKVYSIFWQPSGHYIPPSYVSTVNQYFADVAHDNYKTSNVYATDTQITTS